MAIKSTEFGAFEGKRVDQFHLVSDTGAEVDIINWGVVVRDWRVPVAGGGPRSVVLGFDSFEPYPVHSPYFGAIAGRVANRIGEAQFTLDGETYRTNANWGSHTLHGGKAGLGTLLWDAEPDSAGNAIRFTHSSPDGHMGFPGNVAFAATYTLTGNRLRLEITAEADRRTPISVVQHQYFNLGTGSDVLDHRYQVLGHAYTAVGKDLIPTGAILPVAGTQWDLRTPRTMRDETGAPVDYDGNVVLATGRDHAEPVAIVTGPDGALTLRLWTDRPGVQVYNSVWTDVDGGGKRYGKHAGFCLEDQDLPDAVNNPHFPSVIYGPDRPYRHVCEIEIA